MSWKDWSYTKKGLIIGLVYGIVSSVFSYIITLQGREVLEDNILLIFLSIILTWPLFISLIFFAPIYYLGVLTSSSILLVVANFITDNVYVFGIIGLALFGTLIGWIVGKIKKK